MNCDWFIGDRCFVIRYADSVYSISKGAIRSIKPFNSNWKGNTIEDYVADIELINTGEIVTYCVSCIYATETAAADAICNFY